MFAFAVPLALLALQQAAPTPQPAVVSPAPADAAATLGALADQLEARFADPAAGRAYAAMLRRNVASGRYAGLDAAGLAERVTADLQAVHSDGHLRLIAPGAGPADAGPRRVVVATPAGAGAPPPGTAVQRRRPPAIDETATLAPGIAYIRFNSFDGAEATLAQLRRFLDEQRTATTLIIDARTHHGGGLDEMDALFGRLYARPTPLMVLDSRADVPGAEDSAFGVRPTVTRQDGAPGIIRFQHSALPDGTDTALRTGEVFLLTSPVTGSAGEHLALALKTTGRATLIGGTTAGAGRYGDYAELPGGFRAFIGTGRSYAPGGTGWEGTGVAPDVAVAPEAALVEALVRVGLPRAQAEAIDAQHRPTLPMQRRQPVRAPAAAS